MTVVEVTLLLLILILFYGWLKFRQEYWHHRGVVHCAPNLITGNVSELGTKKQLSQIMQETYEKFKGKAPFAGFNFFIARTAIILDLQLIKKILVSDFHVFDARGIYFNEKDDPLTGNLFFVDGERWRTIRPKLSPTFTSSKMKLMFQTIVGIGHELSNVMAENCGVVELTDMLARYTADVIGTCAFGLQCNSLRNAKAEFVEMGKTYINKTRHLKIVEALITAYPLIARKLHMRVIRNDVHDFYMGIVKQTIKYREEHKHIQHNDFMEIMMEMRDKENGLKIEELAANAFVFFIAGYETSSVTMAYALYELAKHQEVQRQAREEVFRVLEKYGGKFEYDAMKELQYLNQVIDETLRMHPVISNLFRRANRRYETSDPKYFIEAGSLVIIPTLGIHYDPDIYPEPYLFKPERFTAEAIRSRPACSWLPFGEGPRNCIGLRFGKMQTIVGLTLLLKSFKFSFAAETEDPPALNLTSLTLVPANGIRLKVEKLC